MIINFEFEHNISSKDLLVQVQISSELIELNLAHQIKPLRVEFELPLHNQTVTVTFLCNDPHIVNFPLLITNIVLDDFYKSKNILHKGTPVFDQRFLELAKQKNIYLDPTVNDSNRLDFTGKLVYQYTWPFYKNLFIYSND
jgi:hypothetical protein